MGRLAGFKYRQIIKKLKKLGFAFDRQAAGSHEIWYKPDTDSYTTIPNHTGDSARCRSRLLYTRYFYLLSPAIVEFSTA